MESLRPDRTLLNPNFEGYKLSIDALNVSSTTLPSEVTQVPLGDELLISFQHMRAFGNLNHLVFDSWTDGGKNEAVYFVTENYEVQRAAVKVSFCLLLFKDKRLPLKIKISYHILMEYDVRLNQCTCCSYNFFVLDPMQEVVPCRRATFPA